MAKPYIGPLFLPRTNTIFELKEDWRIDNVCIRGYSSWRMDTVPISKMDMYGIQCVKDSVNSPGFCDDDVIWLIPKGNKFKLTIHSGKYYIEFTKKLNPSGVYNIMIRKSSFELPLVELV